MSIFEDGGTVNRNFAFSDDHLNVKYYERVKNIEKRQIRLKLKGKYEELGEFNMSYHASLSYIHKKETLV